MGWEAERAEDLYWENYRLTPAARARVVREINDREDTILYGNDYDDHGNLRSWSTAPVSRKAPSMNPKQTAAQLRELIKKAQIELAFLEKVPGEPDEKITTFTVNFAGSSKDYVYVALKIENGLWKVSGRHFAHGNYSWEGIFERFDQIKAQVQYMSTPVEYRSEQVSR